MSREEADALIALIDALEEITNHAAIKRKLEDQGYDAALVDRALKKLGEIAGRDAGWDL